MEEGKILGNIISSHGVKIGIDKVEAINTIPLPKHEKYLQSIFLEGLFQIWLREVNI